MRTKEITYHANPWRKLRRDIRGRFCYHSAMRRNILVCNDDGIDAEGLHKLTGALSSVGDVYVCSPHEQQSASGHGITIKKLVCFEDIPFPEARCAVSMEGTPADCVKMGLELYRSRGVEIDMVFSGFNHGMNLGTDTLYSGTVSAAIEGAICGLPAAAMSIGSNFSFHKKPENFDAAMKLAVQIAESDMFSKRISEKPEEFDVNFMHDDHVVLSVNVPDLPTEEIKGVKVCPLSYRAYDEWFNERSDGSGRTGYYYAGEPMVLGEADADDSDVIANMLGYIAITPLHFDLTDRGRIEALRGMDWNY